jgi:hypothetical protein
MEQIIAACGLDCAVCPAYMATKADDRAALAKLAEDWGKQFGFSATADEVRCHGCHATDGVQIGHCSQCGVRLCAVDKGHRTCASCADYGCDKLSAFIKDIPGAKERLETLRN